MCVCTIPIARTKVKVKDECFKVCTEDHIKGKIGGSKMDPIKFNHDRM